MPSYSIVETRSLPKPTGHLDVERPHLMAKLAGSGAPRLAWVAAPAGYGKTTLLAQLARLDCAEHPVAWATLDTQDNSPRQLLGQLLKAFELGGILSSDDVVTALDALTTDPEAAWTCLINGIRRLSKPVRLFLDNVERVRSSSSLQRLQRLMDQAPDNLNFVLASRCQPQLGLSQWRLQDSLAILDESQLAFTADEIGTVCAKTGVTLSPSEAYQLKATTGGWAAAVRLWLAAWQESQESFQAQSLLDSVVTDRAQHYLSLFLQEEVLSRLPEKLRRFLSDTCVVNGFNEELAALLSGQDRVNQTLGRLQRLRLFIHPENHQQGWYRYHPLFRQALYINREQTDPTGTRNLHKKAGDWLLAEGHYGEGLYHYARNQSFSTLLSVLEQHTFDLLREGEINDILDSLAKIPSGLGDDHFALAMTEASVAHVSRDINRIKASINQLAPLRRKTSKHSELKRIDQTIAFLRSQIAYLGGNPGHGLRLCTDALTTTEPSLPSSAGESVIRFHRANCYHALGILDRAYDDAKRALDDLRQAGLSGYTNTLGLLLGQIELQRGQVADAEKRFSKMTAGRDPNQAPARNFYDVYHYLGLGMVRREQNHLGSAESLLNQAAAIALSFEHSAALPWIFHHLALVSWARGDHEKALELWRECQRLAWKNRHYGMYRISGAYRVRLDLLKDPEHRDYAGQWRQEWQQIERRYGANTFPEEQLAWSWWCYRHGNDGKALETCEALLTQLAERDQIDLLIDTWLLKVNILRHRDDLDSALQALNQAIALAEDHHLGSLFFREGRELVDLIQLANSRKDRQRAGLNQPLSRQGFVEQQIASLNAPRAKQQSPNPLLPFEQLTKRELDVLKLVAEGQPNQQIADRLFVGVSTVKTHINSIFRKLEVSTREDACAKAARFHLIP